MDAVIDLLGTLVQLAIVGAVIASMWRIFEKANRPGWHALIPIYNVVVLCEIAGKPLWFAALLMLPFINIVAIVLIGIGLAKRFGQSTGFGVGLGLLAPIFYPLLAFGRAEFDARAASSFAVR